MKYFFIVGTVYRKKSPKRRTTRMGFTRERYMMLELGYVSSWQWQISKCDVMF